MTPSAFLAAGLIAVQPVQTTEVFNVPSGPAVQSINRLAAQAGVDVSITADLRGRTTQQVRGRLTIDAAFERLLAPLGARAVRIGHGVYRVEPAARPQPARPLRSTLAPAHTVPPTTLLSEVVVTALPPVGLNPASGRSLIDPGALERIEGLAASDALADLSATIDSTRQGSGRNKLFVRGLADSAINGPLQATVGQYMGDLRLNYGSPDPDLALVDFRRIEVFEGPQGSRFGINSIGGVGRLTPAPPARAERSGRFTIGGGVTSGGAPNADASLVLNQPFGQDVAGRLVAYARRDGGFLDNPDQDVREKDDVQTTGIRTALRWVRDDWTVELSGLAQQVEGGDAQTVPVGDTRFQKSGVIEPYRSTIALGGVTVRGGLGAARLTWASSLSRQALDERFDATQPASVVPSVVDRRQVARTLSTEVRLDTRLSEQWAWSGGIALAAGETQVERRRRELADNPTPVSGADLTRNFSEAAVFGEAAWSPDPGLRIAAGGRLSSVRIDSDIVTIDPVIVRRSNDRGGAAIRFSPSLSARWDVSPGAALFARVERAVRPAGVNEASGAFERYQGDRVTLFEIGSRSVQWRDDLSGEISVGWLDWRDVQADIVTQGGDLVTDNVGDGVIGFVSLKAAWRPRPTLDVSGGLFFNDSRLTATRFSVIGGGTTEIPNVASLGAQLSADHDVGDLGGVPLRLGADLRYVGPSRLGVGPALDVPQGGYLRTEFTVRWGDDRRAAVLRISNPFDVKGVRYGIGSPYQLFEPQAVPVRPLAIRLGFETAF